MVDVVYVDKFGFNLHLTCWFGRARWWQRCEQICPTQRGRSLSLVVWVGHEGSHCTRCHTWCLQYEQTLKNSFKPRSFIALIDKGSSSWTIVPYQQISWSTTNVWGCWTYLTSFAIIQSISQCHIMSIWTHQNHVRWNDLQDCQTLFFTLNDDIRAINANTVQDWIQRTQYNFW